MQLINKQIIQFNTINDNIVYNMETVNNIPDMCIDNILFDKLNKYKYMIEKINSNLWDFYKKLSNEYEFLHQSIKTKNQNIGVANYDPISRAFFKMWEISKDFDLIDYSKPDIIYGALAEGPGGFIECFNYIRRKYSQNVNDTIKCITLNSSSSDIPGWKKSNRIFRECNNYTISYGADDTGNLYKIQNIEHFGNLFNIGKADIVSGDGGYDFSKDYTNQEISALQLIFCEIVSALHILKTKGHFVVKIFDIFHTCMVDIIFILCRYFDKVYITKPCSSRSANSEKYIVCKGFKGITQEDLSKLLNIVENIEIAIHNKLNISRIISNKIPEDFMAIIHSSNIYFTEKQIKALLKALTFAKDKLCNEDICLIKQDQLIYSIAWCTKYDFDINSRCRYLKQDNIYNFIPN